MGSVIDDAFQVTDLLAGSAGVEDLPVRPFGSPIVEVNSAVLLDQILTLPDHASPIVAQGSVVQAGPAVRIPPAAAVP